MYTFGTLCCLHAVLQEIEDTWFRKVFKFRGDVPNRVTCSVFNTFLVLQCVYSLFIEDWYLNNQTSHMYMIEFFLYDMAYMVSSPSVKYYTGYIVHHVVSLFLIYLLFAYNLANNLTSNIVIILLEAPTPLINLTRIHDYMYPRNIVYTTITHTVYGTFRLVGLPIVLCLSPWAFDEIHPVLYFVYFLFMMLTMASYRWFMAMIVKPKQAEMCMTM